MGKQMADNGTALSIEGGVQQGAGSSIIDNSDNSVDNSVNTTVNGDVAGDVNTSVNRGIVRPVTFGALIDEHLATDEGKEAFTGDLSDYDGDEDVFNQELSEGLHSIDQALSRIDAGGLEPEAAIAPIENAFSFAPAILATGIKVALPQLSPAIALAIELAVKSSGVENTFLQELQGELS